MMDSSPPLETRPIAVRSERSIELLSADGTKLDARLAVPEGATRAVVLAHPHPLYGGSMDNPVVVALGRVLAERAVATLRFDFRGVGKSEGRHGGGVPEMDDLLGAVAAMRRLVPGAKVAVAGYSFGSWVALQVARAHLGSAPAAEIDRLALVAPAASLLSYDTLLPGGRRFERPIAVALGDRDNFCDPARARVLAARLGASIAVLSGEDHFFARSRRRLAELLAPFLLGDADRIDEGALA